MLMTRKSPDHNTNGTRRTDAAGTAGAVRGLVREEVASLRARAGSRAARVARQLREQRDELVRKQKERAARELASVGQAVRVAADHLHDRRLHALADYADSAADGLERVARLVRQREFSLLADDVARAARQRPGVALAAAFVAGLAIGRFIRAGLAEDETSNESAQADAPRRRLSRRQ